MGAGRAAPHGGEMRVERESEFKLTVERSRFHAVLFPAASDADVAAMLRRQKSEHRKANHHCWARRGPDGRGGVLERSKDDGEVGHPGRVLLELLRHGEIEGAIVVSRVFGGVKLGRGGVARAFREAAAGAVAAYGSGSGRR